MEIHYERFATNYGLAMNKATEKVGKDSEYIVFFNDSVPVGDKPFLEPLRKELSFIPKKELLEDKSLSRVGIVSGKIIDSTKTK